MQSSILQPLYILIINGKQMPAWMYNCCTKVSFKESDSDGGVEELKIYFDDPEMQIVESKTFVEKKTKISCKMGYINDNNFGTVFNGIVQVVDNDYPESGRISLEITCYNTAYNMNESEKSKTWKNKTYSAIVISIAKKYGLTPVVDSTEKILKSKNAKVVQSKLSDLAFLKRLAKKCGYKLKIVSATKKLYFVKTKNFKINNTLTVDYKCGNQRLISFKPSYNDYKKAMKYHSSNLNIKKNKKVSTKTTSSKNNVTNSKNKTKKDTSYTTKSGDTLTKIAKKFYGSSDSKYINKIINANSKTLGKKNLKVLKKNLVLIIPK